MKVFFCIDVTIEEAEILRRTVAPTLPLLLLSLTLDEETDAVGVGFGDCLGLCSRGEMYSRRDSREEVGLVGDVALRADRGADSWAEASSDGGGRAREGTCVSAFEPREERLLSTFASEGGGVLIIKSPEEELLDLSEGGEEEGTRVERTSWMRLGRTTEDTSSAISLEVIFHTTSLLFRIGESRSRTSL